MLTRASRAGHLVLHLFLLCTLFLLGHLTEAQLAGRNAPTPKRTCRDGAGTGRSSRALAATTATFGRLLFDHGTSIVGALGCSIAYTATRAAGRYTKRVERLAFDFPVRVLFDGRAMNIFKVRHAARQLDHAPNDERGRAWWSIGNDRLRRCTSTAGEPIQSTLAGRGATTLTGSFAVERIVACARRRRAADVSVIVDAVGLRRPWRVRRRSRKCHGAKCQATRYAGQRRR